jgi:NAD(P)-dependent dehydrogenase (short-subunit alcohol dehydrogenase family)
VAVITGATGLLGRQHCRALAEAGAHVVVSDLGWGACQDLAAELAERASVAAFGHALDVTRPDSVVGLYQAARQRFGRVDVLVNNAALNEKVEEGNAGEPVPFESYPLGEWERAFAVNVTGAFLCCQVFGGEMARRGDGSIINIASTYGLVAPDQSLYRRADGTQSFYKSAAYPTTKGALLALTRYLAAYWGEAGVRVNALCPGGVESGQEPEFIERYAARTPLRRMAQPHDYQGALLFLASDASAYMTGASLVVDGGFTVW